MTVSDIAKQSQINRGTFYLHYVDKYDLMEKLEMEAIYDLKQILLLDTNPKNLEDPIQLIPYESILHALIYIKNDFEFIQALASEGGDPHFMQMVKDILNELVLSKLDKSKSLQFSRKNLPDDYAKEILLSSIVGVVNLWIKKGGEETPEQIATIITKAKEISPYELLL
ncbi:TetR family transcriptional regulator [Enterococcus thailandicus]|nr:MULTISPECIES: TetR/AcrR family transcriptional regulator [Enterococcus]MDK4352370.1 TetR/AcrR family transcriptional regulator [Enterococcus thailandicus]MDT2794342.1 TetR/AcrR family transcriptional regulator C-terminal domain-containing protein [Enterococcus thailandicus]MDT2845399.1 TetR/AcrR family transcriptional regulator C-terminal domain-containing protein [Enterococcus thailandicus]MEA4828467.1 TetR/AcrR family transcriptional regulator C-terminal domain-containing protein [Enteroco